jgi:HEAT repeat protein
MNPQRFWLVALSLVVIGAIGCPTHRSSPPAERVTSRGSDATTQQLVAALTDEDALTRLEAAQRLLARDPELVAEHDFVGIAVESLSDESDEVRRDAARLLGSVSTGEREAVSALQRAFRDEHFEVRAQAAAAIARMTLPSGSPATIGVEHYGPRSTGAAATVDLLPLVPDLVKLTDDEVVVVRVAAVDALLAVQPEPSDEAVSRISAVVTGVFEVWYPFCSATQTTTVETTVRAVPFRVEKRTRVSNRQSPPTEDDFERALADTGMEAPPGGTYSTTLDFDKQALQALADALVAWATRVELRLAEDGINLWECGPSE